MPKKKLSTFAREMKNTSFRKKFEKEYSEFVLAELMTTLMKDNRKTVRKLAAEVGLSATAIQKLRSGKQEDIKLNNFMSISQACGYHLILEKENERIILS